ncbi:MAG TPA: hypothetical protein VHB21_19380, partial [Minicystis sp.]|nr:hypothetical protein [Minicystis sp.]
MAALVSRVARTLFARELLPTRVLWWFVGEGTLEWAELLARELATELGGRAAARRAVAEAAATMLRRRYDVLRAALPGLPDAGAEPAAGGRVLGARSHGASQPRAAGVFDAAGGAPR